MLKLHSAIPDMTRGSNPQPGMYRLRALGGQEHVSEHVECPGIRLAARSAEGVYGRAHGDFAEACFFE